MNLFKLLNFFFRSFDTGGPWVFCWVHSAISWPESQSSPESMVLESAEVQILVLLLVPSISVIQRTCTWRNRNYTRSMFTQFPAKPTQLGHQLAGVYLEDFMIVFCACPHFSIALPPRATPIHFRLWCGIEHSANLNLAQAMVFSLKIKSR